MISAVCTKDTSTTRNSPFDLDNTSGFQSWRDQKLAHYPRSGDDLLVEIKNPLQLTTGEQSALFERLRKTNMALYDTRKPGVADKAIPREIARQLGLVNLDHHLCVDEDGISPLHVSANATRQDYIPYTNKPINWHTDGYYNAPEHQINGMVLHCVHTAAQGGENAFVDHEIVYVLLREENPDYIHALMQPDVMLIPANIHNGELIRPEVKGPVFSIVGDEPYLHMRYTARTHSIEWKDETLVHDAVAALTGILNSDVPYIFHHRMAPGQGIVCNNVLHKRTGFVDGEGETEKRLVYRARYYDRVGG